MKIEIKAALIGATAAFAAALVPVITGWFSHDVDDQSPLRLTLTVPNEASPYQAYRLTRKHPAYKAYKGVVSDLGFFIWPEADLTELLNLLGLGTETNPPMFVARATR